METYALSELARNTAAVRHDAARAPVMITDRNKPRFVLMAVEHFEKLSGRAQPSWKALEASEASAEHADLLSEGLDELMGDAKGG